jgi:hypothetical protein
MKKILSITAMFLFMLNQSNAQIRLIGASNNFGSGQIEILEWNALDSSSVESYPTELQGYYMGSSVFNSYNSNYYLTGITGDSSGLLSFNSKTNSQNLSNYTLFSNITEIDMSTGKIYNLTSDSIGYFSVNEYDISTGTDSIIGIVSEPGINGIITEAICFDSNNGILYYLGYDNTPSRCLYSIPVRNTDFSFTKAVIASSGAYNNFLGVNYDNVSNRIFALNSVFDSTGTFTDFSVIDIDPITAEITTRAQLLLYPYFVAGSSSFDQNSGSLLWVGIDTTFNQKMIVFNTNTNTYEAGFVPGSVSEIVCDNFEFAQNAYPVTAIQDNNKKSFSIYPNPASKNITLQTDGLDNAGIVKIYSMNGVLCLSDEINTLNKEINIESLNPGMYVLTVQSSAEIQTKRLVIQ